MTYGQKIIDAIISGAFIDIRDVPYDCPQAIMDDGSIQEAQIAPHDHLSVWSSNAEEQLTTLVQEFVRDGICECLTRIQDLEVERDRLQRAAYECLTRIQDLEVDRARLQRAADEIYGDETP
jgi:hypothetical protein